MGRVSGKVAFITGVARGQGRSHAVRLAEEGADIIGVDICEQIDTVPYPLASTEDLEETVRLVEKTGRRMVAIQADVRDTTALEAAVMNGVGQLGRLDIVVANACNINGFGPAWTLTEQQWDDMLAVGLTGVWKTIKATVPTLLTQNEGGSVILISSTAGIAAEVNVAHYVAAKSGVSGLMRALSAELAPHSIRVNSVHPTNVRTPMLENDAIAELFSGGREGARFSDPDVTKAFKDLSSMPVPYVESVDVSNAVLYLASDEARYVTGAMQIVDLGALSVYKIPHQS
ncbi:mycofactocin-coupled SDR family oxidoreductase [Mycolicibacterium septicum DSM 44393]|uniref:Mycofactocin-coupled SDR family oxidoreductase n=1 Tax=Mycolicibacterium septicum DSM 44393 TaxID=1341646 RepID=A0A7X6RUX0_9MYCO|nr:mycofactocin-coupled SDR family oxidoreductase [Mycolicibacterium septicum]NKZ10794.1 mycofactocin-coupled SDR family oxidoreductase [Mycolicibacterium septicum DSM 44393]